ncbi:MAG: hypothetical protein HY425_03590 [Candidatus Levybacteria bacterium]|nr:hypothetical protein [Candidatus Levybacteria bacterium]
MLRTYLYIPEQLNNQINYTARAQNKSKAEVMRQALENGLRKFKGQGNAGVEVLFELAKLGRKHKLKGPKNSSVKMDDYLWGKDWSKGE